MTAVLRSRIVVVLAACAVIVGACGDDSADRDTTGSSTVVQPPAIGRLGRWDGRAVVPVAPGGIAGGRVHVYVHGWAPGMRAAVDAYPGPGPLLAWAPQAEGARGQGPRATLLAVVAALGAADPGASVLAFSWLDQSATGPSPLDARRSEERTVPNGERLADALREALAPAFGSSGGQLHLIGHSHGAKVVTVAAARARPAQLTLLDSPEEELVALGGAANHLSERLRRLPLGRRPGQTFVDNYFSEFGGRYGDDPGLESVVDVRLYPDQFGVFDFGARHGYAVTWYERSAGDRRAGVGLWWSPLLADKDDTLAPFSEQAWRANGTVVPARELDLVPVPG